MSAYIAKRLILSFFTVVMISMLAFAIIELPEGDLASKRYQRTIHNVGSDESYAQELLQELRTYLGLDRPIYVRYGIWVWRMVRYGDLGRAFGSQSAGLAYQQRVKEIIGDRLWTTVALTGFTIIVTWTFAIPVGIYSAVRQHSVGDYVFLRCWDFSGLAVPDFLLGLVLMYIFFAYFNMNVGGLFSADYTNAPWSLAKLLDLINHLWIPAIVLGTSGTAGLIRVMRNNLLDELSKPYVVTARAKGVRSWRLIIKYPVRVGYQSYDQHGGLSAALPDQRERDRVGGAKPADDRAGAVDRHSGRGHIPGRLRDPDARHADGGRHPDLRHPPGHSGPAHQVHRSVA